MGVARVVGTLPAAVAVATLLASAIVVLNAAINARKAAPC